MNRDVKSKGLVVMGFVTAVLLAAAFRIDRPASGVVPGLVLAVGLQSMVAFWALFWALPRSNGAFFSIFVGDALLRLAGLGLTAWWLWSGRLPFAGPLITLACAYALLSLVQIPFFYRAR